MDIFWNHTGTISVAVITAVLTTIVVEHFAKPKLEARKHRLIRDRQQVDEVIFAFQKAGLTLGSIIMTGDKPSNSIIATVRKERISQLAHDLDHLENTFSRLSVRFVSKHKEHIGLTLFFIGYVRGVLAASGGYENVLDSEIEQFSEDISMFDTYFVANVDIRDSQEPLVKRWFWKRFTSKEYVIEARQVIDLRYSGK